MMIAITATLLSACSTSFQHTTTTSASDDAIWSAWTDVTTWDDWDEEVEYARIEGAYAPGSRGVVKSPGNPESAFEVKEVEEKKRTVYHVRLPGGRLELERTLEAVDADTRAFTHKVSFRGPMGWFFSALLKRRYERALPGVMDELKQQAEARDASL